MKLYFLLSLCCLTINLFGQVKPEIKSSTDFTMKDVKFTSSGVTLEGTVFKPKHPDAAIVLVHGSGQEKRMVDLATRLAENGIAVLTYDKRGVGKSGGIYAGPEVGTNNIDSANLNLLGLDASAASNELLKHIKVKQMPLGLMGASQAGWIIPIATTLNSKINFMVIFSGPLINTLEQLRFQFYTNGNSKFWETHTEEDARQHIRNDPDRYQFAPTDARDALAKLSVPGLWLFGGKDIQVPVNLSIEHLNTLMAQGKPYEYHLFPELGHNTGYSASPEPFNKAVEWIKTLEGRMKRK